MKFEFDPEKSRANKIKHGIDFEEAQFLWIEPNRVTFIARFEKEDRYGLIAIHQEVLWCAIFTYRRGGIRIISVRRARKYEEELYHHREGI
jgi:uncharacterized protein